MIKKFVLTLAKQIVKNVNSFGFVVCFKRKIGTQISNFIDICIELFINQNCY